MGLSRTLEVWKPLRGYLPERCYEVSNRGRVRAILPVTRWHDAGLNILRQSKHGQGYRMTSLRTKDRGYVEELTHVLVAKMFVGPPPSMRHEVNHKDLDKANNCDWNLEWVTHSQNGKHRILNGAPYKYPDRRGERNSQARTPIYIVRKIKREFTGAYGEQSYLARKYGMPVSRLHCIVRGRSWVGSEYE